VIAQVSWISEQLGKGEKDHKIQQSIFGQILFDNLRQGDTDMRWSHAAYNGHELYQMYNQKFPNDTIMPENEAHGSELAEKEAHEAIEIIRQWLKEYGTRWNAFVAKPNEHSKKLQKQYQGSRDHYNYIKRQFEETTEDFRLVSEVNLINEIVKNKRTELTEKDRNALKYLDTIISMLNKGKHIEIEDVVENVGILLNDISYSIILTNNTVFLNVLSPKQDEFLAGSFDFDSFKNNVQAELTTAEAADEDPELITKLNKYWHL
jgi:hypothetical protein